MCASRSLKSKRRQARRRVGRDLDDHALDHPGQPRPRLRPGHRLRAGRGRRRWARAAAPWSARDGAGQGAGRRRSARRPSSRQGRWPSSRAAISTALIAAHPLRGQGYDFDVPPAARRLRHRRCRHRLRPYRARPWRRRLRAGRRQRRRGAGHGGRGRHLLSARAAVRRQARLHVGRQEGRRQPRRDRGARQGAASCWRTGRITHSYPHSWRSKAPVIFRNAPQWFIAMDKPIAEIGGTLREKALAAIDATRFVPRAGYNRLRCDDREPARLVRLAPARLGRADRGVRRQGDRRAAARSRGDGRASSRPSRAEGADAWFDSPPERFLGNKYEADDYEQVDGHPRRLVRLGLARMPSRSRAIPSCKWPADLYLEGSDQHRGWFHSSLLESCGTRGRAPYDGVLTHGFTLDEQGRKMSKSLGNITAPQDGVRPVRRRHPAPVGGRHRLHRGPAHRPGDPEAPGRRLSPAAQHAALPAGQPRRLLGGARRSAYAEMPELERWVLHRLAELDAMFRQAVDDFDFHTIATELHNFCAVDLSALLFRHPQGRDLLRRARRRCAGAPARTVMAELFSFLTAWLAPITCFTAEEAWLARPKDVPDGARTACICGSIPRSRGLARRGAGREVEDGARAAPRRHRRARARARREAHRLQPAGRAAASMPRRNISRRSTASTSAEICITSGGELVEGKAPAGAFTLPDVAGRGGRAAAGAGQQMRTLLAGAGGGRQVGRNTRCSAGAAKARWQGRRMRPIDRQAMVAGRASPWSPTRSPSSSCWAT